jgi:hypothetical protein
MLAFYAIDVESEASALAGKLPNPGAHNPVTLPRSFHAFRASQSRITSAHGSVVAL